MFKQLISNIAYTELEQRIAALEKKIGIKPEVTEKKKIKHHYKDDLTVIAGIGTKLQVKLNVAGIRTLSQLSRLTKKQAEALGKTIGFPERVTRERWVEQAKHILDK